MTKTLLLSLVILLVVYGSYHFGYDQGFSDVQEEWKQQESSLVTRVAELEAQHAVRQEQVAREAQELRIAYEADVLSQRTAYEQRLSQAARRAEVYRSQAAAGSASSGDLAAHAARLDRSLEEGRGLVRELRSALGLREDQLRLLGQQLESDRRLAAEDL